MQWDVPRHVVILGPSTPMLAPVFEDTPVTCLGGASVTESDRVLQIISEGGGTPAMRPYFKYLTVPIIRRGAEGSR